MPTESLPLSAAPEGWERSVPKGRVVKILDVLDVLFEHLTPTLCRTVFEKVRHKERERKWTFEAIAQFWAAMIVRQPPSLTHGLLQTRKGKQAKDTLWPQVQAEVNAFFEKCWALRPRFFQTLFEEFTGSLLSDAPETYAAWMAPLRERFPQVLIIDGSKLDVISRRLKLLWPVRWAILPGSITAFYDLFRGVNRKVLFYPDAAESEFKRAKSELGWIDRGSLVIGDRAYAFPLYFHLLAQHGSFGLFRRHKALKWKRVRILERRQGERSFLEDALVESPTGLQARLIRCRAPKGRLELITSVLDPKHLSAKEAVALYRLRWSIERMFLELKKTLKLHGLYASHPNLVAQQVYATALVYNAMRVVQARIAKRAGLLPEQISPEKLFPILARSSSEWVVSRRTMIAVREANPGVQIQEPDWAKMEFATLELRGILLQRRHGPRTRSHPDDRGWKSLRQVPGSEALLIKTA